MPPKKQKRAPRRRAPGGGTIAALLATLDVPADALAAANTLEEEFNVIKRAFHVAAKTHHPDKGGDEAAFRDVRAAFDVLKQKFTDASGGSFSYKTARGSKASTAKEWKDASATADDTHRPSYDFYAAAAEADMPLYRAELAKSNRSKCNADDGKNRHNCKFEDPFKIPKGHVRIGVLDAQSGGRVLYTGPHTTPFAW
ncbi:uncharacterized protein MICPUCDRAFT_43547 [Micromonas pusilla CCMP1545]|uniref:Predicted protein n=1 Tax=Micromonas pusilla (strain CCMP1545) TaxID=564608 RepID=C1N9G0_MICPC|nr:uncharacterized protein MICPUCDRAFT_43547 [Micromonas pusilla CCMP1545]EEH51350.1 predicted protein [Micromonas pusilla CCMP1545]|eukprot:XP_003064445.1 predicted protein [Micromonas pusilla CCMP1545]